MISRPSEQSQQSEATSSVTMAGLFHVASQLGSGTGDEPESLLAQYKQQLEAVCVEIDQSAYPGLIDLVVIMDEGLEALIERGQVPDDFENEFLQEFPRLLADYLLMPGSRIAASILLKHFKKTQWIRPITLDEHKMLMDLILHSKDGDYQEQDDTMESIDLSQFETAIDAASLDDGEQAAVDVVIAAEDDDLLDLDQLMDATTDDGTAGDDIEPSEPDSSPDAERSLDSFFSDTQEEPVVDAPPSAEHESDPSPLDAQQQELIDLVKAELEEIRLSLGQLDSTSKDDLQEQLSGFSEQAVNISNAINLMGLAGLAQSSLFISDNLQKFSETDSAISEAGLQLLKAWPDAFLACLDNVFDDSGSAALVEYLKDPAWMVSMPEDRLSSLQTLLSNPSFAEEEVESRQVTATDDDVSLELPDDVNQELLDGLLQDLPHQTEEFANSIQNLNTGGSLADIEVAQRIAHTLKGAANVVGVRGVANLTHHLEDILEAQAKAGAKPVPSLMDSLVSAADCLETMSEALLGVDAPPDNAVQVLQSVLDWANRLDQDGVPENDRPPSADSQPVDQPVGKVPEALANVAVDRETASVENMLRVPATLADELLRLAGENLISTGQVQERIRNIMKSQDAIQLHNQSLQQISFDLEHLIDVQGIATHFNQNHRDNNDFDPLEMDQYNEMHSVSRRLIEIAADSIQLTDSLDTELTDLHNLVISQNQLQKESQELVLRTRMVPTRTVISRLRRGVRQACRVTGKQVELNVEDNDTYMDSEVLNDLIEPLMHVLRNAVDHGIESADARKQAGKPDVGCVLLSFERKGDQIVINVEDDGQGLNLQGIRQKAVANGLVPGDVDMTDDAVTRLVLEAGLSTRDEVTQVSGRGIGLDVVNVKIRELKGSINIYSSQGSGSRFEMILPISSFSTHSLLVRVREHIYAISNRGVEEILYPGLGELCEIGDQTVFQLENQAYGAMLIDELLDFSDDRRQIDRSSRPILLVRDDSGARTAILVQEVLDSRDVVVKSMGHYLPKLKGIIGATVLGDGSVAPVMDLPEMLLHRSAHHARTTTGQSSQQTEIKRLPYVLVVDDSLSARRSLAQFVQDLGMDVRTARDGMEAVSLIEARQPDLMLVDMEMPRMNGLELTSHIRASSNTNNMPVIMITSRSTDKHRAAAMEKGVNHFMVKPFVEEELAQHINDALDIAS